MPAARRRAQNPEGACVSRTDSLLLQVGNLGLAWTTGVSLDLVSPSLPCPIPPPEGSAGRREGVKCFWQPRLCVCCVCRSSPFLGCSNRGWPGMFAMRSWAGGRWWKRGLWRLAEPAPQLSNRPGPAGSCNCCPSCLSPPPTPLLLPPPTACQAAGAALGPAEGGGGPEARSPEARGDTEGLPRRDRDGVLSVQPCWPRKGRAFAQVTQQGTP